MVWPLRRVLAEGVLINTTWNPLGSFPLFSWCLWPFQDCRYQTKPLSEAKELKRSLKSRLHDSVWSKTKKKKRKKNSRRRKGKKKVSLCISLCQYLMCCLWRSGDTMGLNSLPVSCLFFPVCMWKWHGHAWKTMQNQSKHWTKLVTTFTRKQHLITTCESQNRWRKKQL